MALLEPGFSPAATPATTIGRLRIPGPDPEIDAAIDRVLAAAELTLVEVRLEGWSRSESAFQSLISGEAWVNNGDLLADRGGISDKIADRVAAARRHQRDDGSSASSTTGMASRGGSSIRPGAAASTADPARARPATERRRPLQLDRPDQSIQREWITRPVAPGPRTWSGLARQPSAGRSTTQRRAAVRNRLGRRGSEQGVDQTRRSSGFRYRLFYRSHPASAHRYRGLQRPGNRTQPSATDRSPLHTSWVAASTNTHSAHLSLRRAPASHPRPRSRERGTGGTEAQRGPAESGRQGSMAPCQGRRRGRRHRARAAPRRRRTAPPAEWSDPTGSGACRNSHRRTRGSLRCRPGWDWRQRG